MIDGLRKKPEPVNTSQELTAPELLTKSQRLDCFYAILGDYLDIYDGMSLKQLRRWAKVCTGRGDSDMGNVFDYLSYLKGSSDQESARQLAGEVFKILALSELGVTVEEMVGHEVEAEKIALKGLERSVANSYNKVGIDSGIA